MTMKTIQNSCWYGFFALCVALAGCQEKTPKDEETVSRGNISISVDESLQPLLDAERDAFEARSKNYAKINTIYVPEELAVQLMLHDSTRVAVVTRHLKPAERKVFDDANLKYRAYHMATDAVAFITNGASSDTLISVDEAADVMKGAKTTWNQLKYGKSTDKISFVVDNDHSSNLQYLLDTLGVPDKKKAPIFAMKSNKEVIDYVKKNRGAIGVIGVNWISDIDDPEHPQFLNGIRVMGIAQKASANRDDYFQPFQYAIALKKYPLSRNVFLITKEAKRGLGTGFINYVLADAGQRIVLKSGLLPATQVLRLVQIKGM